MFTTSARLYDYIYSFKDYKSEANKIIELINIKNPQANYILDVACGTAEHHKYIKGKFNVDGLDINNEFIEIAKSKNSELNYFIADMLEFNLNKKYDVILCLFSSIAYLKTIEKIKKALATFKNHLNESGIIIIEPWFKPDEFTDGKIFMQTYDGEEMKICRMSKSNIKNNLSIITFYYQILTKTEVNNFTETHELGLFTTEEMKQAFEYAGLKVEYEEEGLIGRGLYIAKHI